MSLTQPPKPDEPQGNPYTPPAPQPQVMEQFETINTSANRAGVPDSQNYWIDGFFPITARNLRTMPGAGSVLYTATGGKTVISYGFYNLGSTAYMAVFLSDGSASQVDMLGNVTQILPANSIISPSILTIGITQYGQQYLVIVAQQANGYWLWDGNLLYGAGTLAPVITLTNAGTGYQTPPAVVFSGGSGSGAAAVATIANGSVTGITVTNPGSGWLAGESVEVTLAGGTAGGSLATLTANMSVTGGGSGGSLSVIFVYSGFSNWYYLNSYSVVAGGTGYSQFVVGAWVGGNGFFNGGTPAIQLAVSAGVITSMTLVGGQPDGAGGRYIYEGSVQPTAAPQDPGNWVVSSVNVVSHGQNYSPSAAVTAVGGDDPITQATLKPIIAGGSIASVQVISGGLYGGNSPAPTLTVTDSTVQATATAQLMPYAIGGNAVETYQGRVWVVNKAVLYWTAPGSFQDFATSDGGGNLTSGSSVLRVGWTALIAANGFLYLIGDSSVDYLSGVQTSGTPPTTTFTLQNADPEVGSPYPASPITFGPDIILANSFGIHVSRGANFDKASEALDGVWNTATNFNGVSLSSAKATIFGKKVFMVLAGIVDPVSNTTVNKLLLWDGKKKWFASVQDFGPLTFIAPQEFNSVLTAWGTDGTHIRPLFQTASTGFAKVVQSRLWDAPGGYQFSKATSRFWSAWNYNSVSSPSVVLNVDSVGINGADGTTFTNSQTYTIAGPAGTGYFLTPPEAVGQQGAFTGMTLTTNAADLELVSAMLQNDPRPSYRG